MLVLHILLLQETKGRTRHRGFFFAEKKCLSDENEKVLVHCEDGRSVSGAIVVAYMMMASKRQNKSLTLLKVRIIHWNVLCNGLTHLFHFVCSSFTLRLNGFVVI